MSAQEDYNAIGSKDKMIRELTGEVGSAKHCPHESLPLAFDWKVAD